MPSIATHKEVEAIFQAALDAPDDTVKVNCGSHGAAMNVRQRLNNWRWKARKDNKIIYKFGHPLHGVCEYDVLTMHVPPAESPDGHYLYLTRRQSLDFVVENLKGERLDQPVPELPRDRPALTIDEVVFDIAPKK